MLQHHEFELQLRDAEWLRLFIQSGMAEREMQSASLNEVELACRCLELGAKESAERAAWAEAKRDVARHEAAMAKLEIEWAINTRAQMESELTQVQRALAVTENACLKAKSERDAAQGIVPGKRGLYESGGREQPLDGRAAFLDFGARDYKR